MTTGEIVIIAVVVALVLVAIAVGLVMARRRPGRRQLKHRFGPEYDRTLATTGHPKETDSQLRERLDQHERLRLRPLSNVDRDAFAQEWRQIQAGFVDNPDGSLEGADGLLSRLLRESGYPVDDFDHQADLISVDHPDLVGHYRRAHAVRGASQQGPVDTEQQRNAFLAYRSLFTELLGQPTAEES